MKISKRFFKLLFLVLLLTGTTSVMAFDWTDVWLTPDQQGQRLMNQQKYQQAAAKFSQPMNIGTALFLAGEYQQAATVFGRSSTAEAHYNRGNAQVLLGNYDTAITAYQSALKQRPGWIEAEENLQIASLRKQAVATPDDDYGGTDGELAANEYVFDLDVVKNKSSGEQIIDAADKQLSEAAMRAMWLRKVETGPAEFLAARFNYQLVVQQSEEAESTEAKNNE